MRLLVHLIMVWVVIVISSSENDNNRPPRPIDGYCNAWKKFDETGVWNDDWESIDYDIKEDLKKLDDDWSHIIDRYPNSKSPLNKYDTYYSTECRRIRRPWNTMSTEERSIYIDGILELRHRGELKMELDEFIAIASVHDDHFGSVTHHDSDYLFWHGYLVWELESRIRNLGDKYKCFAMPYWDITNEYYYRKEDERQIFQTGFGGYGDPDDSWKVNGYSWDITTKQFWSPDHNMVCNAKNDQCPIC